MGFPSKDQIQRILDILDRLDTSKITTAINYETSSQSGGARVESLLIKKVAGR